MSVFDNNEKDDLYYTIEYFLENHTISELLEILAVIMRDKEA